jgi:methionine-rich copper-binding protein CopC
MKISRTLYAASFVAALAFGGIAQAHPKLLLATPAANSAVSKPTKIQLKFSEKLLAPMTGAELTMTAMPGMAGHQPMKMTGMAAAMGADGKTLMLTLKRPLTAGTYLVAWHAVAADTHRVEGKYSFTVK